MAIIEAIVAGIEAATTITEGIQTIGNALDGERSVVLIVENNLAHELERLEDDHAHGGFAVTPPFRIPKKSVAIFGSQDKGFMTGTEGWVQYEVKDNRTEDSAVQLHWNNPFVGANNAFGVAFQNGRFPPLASAYFRVATVIGAGDKEAEMRYSVVRL